jgi:Spy/CpxP family protein refolding chaperone
MWFGWVFGTLCLVGLVRTIGRHRYGFYHHHHPGWAHRYGGFGPDHGVGTGHGHGPWGRGFRRGGRGVLFSILDRLDATPAQEKTIMAAVDELRDTTSELRSTLRGARQDLARAVRAPAFDASAVASSTSFDQIADRFTSAVASALAKIHGVLDDRQRDMLGELIESGFARGF